MSFKSDERRRSSGTSRFTHAVGNALRRVSLARRPSSESMATPSSAQHGGKKQTDQLDRPKPGHIARKPSVDTVTSRSSVSSLQAPTRKLNSSSPASELPATWAEWNFAYANGFIDFGDPPPPPSDLRTSEFVTSTGQFRAPFPLNEVKRQRAVDSIGLFNHTAKKSTRRGSTKDPLKPASPAPPSYPESDGDKSPKYEESVSEAVQRHEGPVYPALKKLAEEAKQRFGVDATTVSLMDRDKQVFLSDETCEFLQERDDVPRELTACSHAMLKASTGTKDPLVIFDFGQDWRFEKNGFGAYSKGFYAAAPIMLPAPLGDDNGAYPGGIFCLLGKKPRAKFSEDDRRELQEMADKASNEIQRFAKEQSEERWQELSKKRGEFARRNKLARKVSSQQQNLDTVVEIPTPPLTPNLSVLDLRDAAEDELFAQADSEREPRRPSLVESIGSNASLGDLRAMSNKPVFGARADSLSGVLAIPADNVPPEIASVLDLSTQLVAESIEIDFSYLVSVDLASPSAKPVRLLSSYGTPIPPPLFSLEAHVEAANSPQASVLYVNDDAHTLDGDFSTGLVVRVGKKGDVGYLLGCFAEDSRRVFNTEDLLFARSFARDLAKYLPEL
ncbi:hypothetical protein JCM10295v2_000662 [Rhodotorula toruloides]